MIPLEVVVLYVKQLGILDLKWLITLWSAHLTSYLTQ
jgi:hypothetical protein